MNGTFIGKLKVTNVINIDQSGKSISGGISVRQHR